jgi:hypothetical protein
MIGTYYYAIIKTIFFINLSTFEKHFRRKFMYSVIKYTYCSYFQKQLITFKTIFV